ncbi:MAG: hypothetical protein ACFBWO_10805 [Paracoccaceae bacterium]
MTVGIAVSGPNAGRAAWRALRAVEAVGRGAVGGFASFVVLTAGGEVLRAETQRGGGAALWDGAGPPETVAAAPLAGLMSSGPDRPEPLSAFAAADPAAGIVTGHRLPILPGPDGVAPIRAALNRLAAGTDPETAVAEALAPDPDGDAGLIALTRDGRIALAETEAVAARDDRGSALVRDAATGLSVGVLHNSIFPHAALAALAVSAAVDAVFPRDAFDARAPLAGLAVAAGPRRREVDAAGRAVALWAPAEGWRGAAWEGSPVRRGAPVTRAGRIVGRVTGECYALARGGVVVGARGEAAVRWRWLAAEAAA